MPSPALTGAHVILYINGKAVGRVVSFRWQRDITHRENVGIDELEPTELVVTGVRVRGTIGLVRTRKDGGAEGAGLTTPTPDLPREQYVSLMLIDRTTDTVLFRAPRVKATSDGWEAAPRQILYGNVSFQAIGASNDIQAANVG